MTTRGSSLISIEDGGVYFVLAKVKGRRTEFHAFVYDSTGTVPNEKPHSGLLIDNRKNATATSPGSSTVVNTW